MSRGSQVWFNGKILPVESAKISLFTHALHYGIGAFEGIRAYKQKNGSGAVFRLTEHIERLFYSASALKMEIPYTVDELINACIEVVGRNNVQHAYIRPLVYYDYGMMGLNPKECPVAVSIACWPWGKYLPHEAIDVKISSFIRLIALLVIVADRLRSFQAGPYACAENQSALKDLQHC